MPRSPRPPNRFRFPSPLAFFFVLAALTQGCTTARYLVQATHGQLALLNHARPIDEVLKDETTPPRTKALLQHVAAVKAFGTANGLKPTKNYTEYVDLHRPAVVYVVSACAPLEFRPRQWHFPILGSFPYLGWFDRKDAERFAEELRADGSDVDLRGAGAYSTLGWFRDAILSSMIPGGPADLGDLVNVIIHESTHATLYIKGQSFFDESLASFVAEGLTPVYLEMKLGKNSPEEKAYLEGMKYEERLQLRFHEVYQELDRLYHSGLPAEEKRGKKNQVLAKLREEFHFRREINNATLVQFKEYGDGRAYFRKTFAKCGSDWRRFLASLSRIKEESFAKNQQEDFASVLESLGECP